MLVEVIKKITLEKYAKVSPLNCLGKVHRLPQQQRREERQSFDDSC